ncbi:MAG: ATP-binding protein [Aliidongia sp.]
MSMLGVSLVAAVVSVLFALAIGGFENARRQRHQAALLAGALGTLSGICYRYRNGCATRIDGVVDDADWPLDLEVLMESLGATDLAALRGALKELAGSGRGFFLRAGGGPSSPRLLEISGHRAVSKKGGRSLDLVWISDITEREAAASARAEAQRDLAVLREVLDRLPAPIWWRDADLKIAGGNRRFVEAPGLSETTSMLATRALGNTAPVGERHVVAVAGERRPFELIEIPLDGGGTIGFGRDRTDIEAIQAERDRLTLGHREVLEALSTAIAIWGPDARLLFYNTAFERLWSLDGDWLASEPSLPELLDQLREMRALPEHADFRRFKADQLAQLTELTEPRDELLHLPDERTLRLRISRHPFGGLTYTYEDVTDKLALERSYNTLIDVQRETLDNLFEGIAVFGSDGRLKLWNPAYGEIWQLQPADLANRPHVTALVDKAQALYDSERNWERTRLAAIEQVTNYTGHSERLERRDGSVLDVNAVPLPDGNVLLSYLDVTDSVRVQRALREKNDALETAGHLKSEFIANVSYELRTPLNAIIGFAEILTNQYFGTLNERQVEYSRGILDSSQRLLSLINDILDLASVEAGQLELERAPVDIHTLLAGILTLSRERARRLDIVLGFDCPTDIGTMVLDERRIRQAMFNLVSNAIKFTPAGGTVTLAARHEGNEMLLSVSDTGIGIAPELHARVFEKFERGDPASRQAGAGLGLSLVKSFIELHGGTVEMESAIAHGTRVVCRLPIEGVAAEPPPAEQPPIELPATPPARLSRSNTRNAAPRLDAPEDAPRAQPVRLRRNRLE